MHVFISGLSILFHWSIFLFLWIVPLKKCICVILSCWFLKYRDLHFLLPSILPHVLFFCLLSRTLVLYILKFLALIFIYFLFFVSLPFISIIRLYQVIWLSLILTSLAAYSIHTSLIHYFLQKFFNVDLHLTKLLRLYMTKNIFITPSDLNGSTVSCKIIGSQFISLYILKILCCLFPG